MDWVQIHLALNHIPVIGIPLSVLMLLAAGAKKNDDAKRLALWFLFVLSAAAIAIKFTGDFAAEQSLEQLAAVKELVVRHEEAGDQVTTSVFFLGLASALALFLGRKARPLRSSTVVVVLLLGIVTSLLYARSAHTGGQISHPELRTKDK